MVYKTAMWDADGVIFDSTPFNFNFLCEMCRLYGINKPFETIEDWKNGVSADWRKNYLNWGFEESSLEDINGRYIEIYSKGIPLNKGIKNIVLQLASKGTKQVVVTSNREKLIKESLENQGLLKHFEFIIEGNSKNGGKEAGIRKALEKTKTELANAVYIGDMINDIIASHNAGIKCIVHTNGLHTKPKLEAIARKYGNVIAFVNSTSRMKKYLL